MRGDSNACALPSRFDCRFEEVEHEFGDADGGQAADEKESSQSPVASSKSVITNLAASNPSTTSHIKMSASIAGRVLESRSSFGFS